MSLQVSEIGLNHRIKHTDRITNATNDFIVSNC